MEDKELPLGTTWLSITKSYKVDLPKFISEPDFIELHIYICKDYCTSQRQHTLSRSKKWPHLVYYWPILIHLDSQLFTQYLLSGYYVLGIVLEVGNMTQKIKFHKCLTQVYILLDMYKEGENEIYLIMINSKKNSEQETGRSFRQWGRLEELILCVRGPRLSPTHTQLSIQRQRVLFSGAIIL